MTTTAPALPDRVFLWGGTTHDRFEADRGGSDDWSCPIADVQLRSAPDGMAVLIAAPRAGLDRVALRWAAPVHPDSMILGDAWERSYGDLGWQHIRPERVLPWYWLAHAPGHPTVGAGVRVRAGSMCSWSVDGDGVTLWLDLRSGAQPVVLGERVLHAATVVSLRSEASVFQAERELCAALCSDAQTPREPLVGANNWYYAYGENFDADAVVRDAATISSLSGDHPVRPFSVIDAGWSSRRSGAPGGPWREGDGSFADMSSVADRIRAEGARPGVWMRPLLTSDPAAPARRTRLDGEWPLDPSREDVLELVRQDVERIVGWGYDLIKHDFSTFDTLAHFVPGQDLGLAAVPWSFADRSRTTAEVFVGLYRAIREGAGDAVVLGCNTVGHLAAGLVEAQRIGDDTSGRNWERTRRMGVNTLGFRLAQHSSFFAADPDCVPATPATPWAKNRQFLKLVAASGTALFVSVDPASRSADVDEDLRRAVRVALDGGVAGGVEPLDQLQTSAPQRWRIGTDERVFDWNLPWGADVGLAPI